MTATFYLFDVEHGQSAALRLPNGRWCVFDLGCTDAFSPVRWIADRATLVARIAGIQTDFKILKATVSHLHGDHLADYISLFWHGPDFLKAVYVDAEYLEDCYTTCADSSAIARIRGFLQWYGDRFSLTTVIPDYGGATVREMCLPVTRARQIGGDANAPVNNASVATRIDIYGNSILLCGDMQKDAWEAIINDNGIYGPAWRPFLSNTDILVAPHHGHRSGYSTDLLYLANPAVVLVSAETQDPNVDSRYSQSPVRGMTIGDTTYNYISTRQKGHIRVDIHPPANPWLSQKGITYWTFGGEALQ